MVQLYEAQVEAELEDDKYRRKLAKLVADTAKAAQAAEKLLRFDIDARDNATRVINKLRAQTIKPKDIDIKADTSAATTKINEFKAVADNISADVDVDLDTTAATEKIRAWEKTTEATTEIDINTNVKNGASVAALNSGLVTASRSAEQLAQRMGGVALAVGAIGVAAAVIPSLGFAGLGLGFGASLEQDQIRLQTLVGDVKQANGLLKEFKQRSDVDPFDLGDYTKTAARFSASTKDINKIREMTIKATQITAQYGGELEFTAKALADVQNKGKLAGQEVIQFANAGIPIQGLVADFLMMNGTLKKMSAEKAIQEVIKLQEQGKITAEVVSGALENAIDPKVTEKFANSFKGRLDLLKNSIKNTAAAFVGLDFDFSGESVVKEGGLFDTVTKSFQKFADTFNSAKFQKPLQEAGNALGEGFADLIDQLPVIIGFMSQFLAISAKITAEIFKMSAKFLEAFGPKIQQALDFASKNAESLAKAFGVLIAAGVGLKIFGVVLGVITPLINGITALAGVVGPVLGYISGAFTSIVAAVQTFGLQMALASGAGVSGFQAVAGAAATALGPVGLIIGAVVAVVIALTSAFTSNRKLLDELIGAFKVLGGGLKYLLGSFGDLATGIIDTLKPIGEFLAPVLTGIVALVGVVAAAFGGIIRVVGAVVKAVGPLIGWLAKLLLVFSPLGIAIGLIRLGFEKFGKPIQEVIKFLGKLVEWVTKAGKVVGEFFGNIIDGAEDALSKIPVIGGFFKESEKGAEKAKKKTKELTEAQKEAADQAVQMAKEQQEAFKGLIPSFQEAINQSLTAGDPAKINESLGKNLEAINKFNEDVKKVTAAGGGQIVLEATRIGGEAGRNLIAAYAKLPEGERQKAIAAYVQLTLDIAKAEAAAQKTFRDQQSRANILEAITRRKAELAEIAKNTPAPPDNFVGPLSASQVAAKELEALNKLDTTLSTEKIKAALAKAGVKIKAASQGEVSKAAKDAATEGKNAVQDAFDTAFKGLDLTKELKKSLGKFEENVGKSFGSSLALNITTTVAIAGFVNKLVSGLKGQFELSLKTQNPFSGIDKNLNEALAKNAKGLIQFLNFFGSMVGAVRSTATAFGSAIASGINAGFNSVVGRGFGDSIYSSIAAGYNRAVGRIEDSLKRVIAVLNAVNNMAGTGRVMSFNGHFPRLEKGTNYLKQTGVALVGERGPELVQLPQASKVRPADATKRYLKDGAESSGKAPIIIHIHGVSMDQAMAEAEARASAAQRRM